MVQEAAVGDWKFIQSLRGGIHVIVGSLFLR